MTAPTLTQHSSDEHNEGDNKECVDEIPTKVEAEAEKPKDEEYDDDCPQHSS